jgi:hypothetical protein|tara:strand:- start:1228 stop:1524 length:297 start_codon:yes stop_codon:yes gene_type:complete
LRVEINLLIFFANRERKTVGGFLSVREGASEDEIMEAMEDFIETAIEDHMNTFTHGLADVVVGSDDLYQMGFSNKNPNLLVKDKEQCNVVIPDTMIVQ